MVEKGMEFEVKLTAPGVATAVSRTGEYLNYVARAETDAEALFRAFKYAEFALEGVLKLRVAEFAEAVK